MHGSPDFNPEKRYDPMTETQFKPGDEVYDETGRAADYVAFAGPDGHLVKPIYQSGDEPYYGKPTVWPKVFRKAPVEKYAAGIEEKEQVLEALAVQLADKREALADIQQKIDDVQKRAELNPALQLVFDFMDGKITHVVTSELKILTFKEAFEDKDGYGRVRAMKLVSLMGDSKGDLAYAISHYSDGSGSSKFIYPATSLEQAQDMIREKILLNIKAWENNSTDGWGKTSGAKTILGLCQKHGIEAPAAMVEHVNRQDEKARLAAVSKAQAELKLAQAELDGQVVFRFSASIEQCDDGYGYARNYIAKHYSGQLPAFDAADLIGMTRYSGGIAVLKKDS